MIPDGPPIELWEWNNDKKHVCETITELETAPHHTSVPRVATSSLDAEYVFHVFQMVLRELRIRGNTWEYVGIHEGNTEYAHRMAMYSMGIREFLPAPREFSI